MSWDDRPFCFFYQACGRMAALRKNGKFVCPGCARGLRGPERPLEALPEKWRVSAGTRLWAQEREAERKLAKKNGHSPAQRQEIIARVREMVAAALGLPPHWYHCQVRNCDGSARQRYLGVLLVLRAGVRPRVKIMLAFNVSVSCSVPCMRCRIAALRKEDPAFDLIVGALEREADELRPPANQKEAAA